MSSILIMAEVVLRFKSSPISHQSLVQVFNAGGLARLFFKWDIFIIVVCALLFAALLITLYQWWALRKEHSRWIRRSGYKVELPGDRGSCAEIKDPNRSEQEIRSFSALFIDSEEEERLRIARKLHDDLSQDITIIVMEVAKLNAQFGNYPAVSELARSIELRARHLASELNTLSHQLHPPHLEMLGLPSAIRAFCQESRALGIIISFKQGYWPSKVPSNVSLCLYRVLQETVAYLGQAGTSKKCNVELKADDNNNIVMRIAAESIFHAEEERNSNVSWIRIRERVRMVNGELRLLTAKEEGTTLEIKIPIGATSAAA